MSKRTQHFSLKVLTINIHKGFTAFNRRFILPELRDAVRTVSADIVCLQEVMGAHEVHPMHFENWPDTPHYEFLADTMWSDYAYGRNAVYPEGHNGNAVLSRFHIEHNENRDVSVGESEKRGLLYCRITPPALDFPIHVGCVHLGLREAHRQAQLQMLADWTNALPEGEPVVVAGDFNDWRQRANHPLKVNAGLEEIFTRSRGRPARTFPVRFPLLRLDRIYVKNAHASSPTALALLNWRHLSDHAPLSAEIHLCNAHGRKENGDNFYPAVFEAISHAQQKVFLETFIWFEDDVGRQLHSALLQAARRGIKIEVLLDGYGSPDLSDEFVNELTAAGVVFRYYDPGPRLFGMRTNLFRRMHRKIVVVDETVAFVGGINYSAEHMSDYGPEA